MSSSLSFQPGDRFAGRYEIERFLGEGHRKVAYLAWDARMQRQVALLLLKPGPAEADPGAVEQETKVLGAIGRHDNIVRLYDLDFEGDIRYMVFEYLPGGTLKEHLANLRDLGSPVPVEEVLRLARQICRALSHLHQNGILHRDLCPANVWLDERGGAHLGDFDTAIFMDHPPETLPAVTNGSFASPEERLGAALDRRSDLYSFGAVLYSVALGDERAVPRPDRLAIARTDLTLSFQDLLVALLDESPDNRPSDADVVLKQLGEIERMSNFDGLLRNASEPAGNEPPELTVRQLLGYWGANRRDPALARTITAALLDRGLTTDPPFEEAWIDDVVRLVHLKPGARLEHMITPTASLRVRHIGSANHELASVPPDAELSLALALMLRHDYSQLAVLSGSRSLKGAVSWKSIAQAQLRNSSCSLRDAVIPAELVDLDDDLLPLIPTIVEKEFVFVRRQDQALAGIITVADLSLEYNRLAKPFLMIGEIERRLRRAISGKFDRATLTRARDPNNVSREVHSVEDLNFGEYCTLLGTQENWARLNWNVDRKLFIKTLDEVRVVRNEVMHFSPDPIDDDQLRLLNNFARWVKVLDPRP